MFIQQIHFVSITTYTAGEKEIIKHPDEIQLDIEFFGDMQTDIFEVEIEAKSGKKLA